MGQPGNALGNAGRQPAYGGIKDVFKTVYKEGGARALYRGVGTSCLTTPFAMVEVSIFRFVSVSVT